MSRVSKAKSSSTVTALSGSAVGVSITTSASGSAGAKGAPVLALASGSPRRRELLRQIGVEFCVVDVGVDETRAAGELPLDYVARLARAKAEAGWRALTAPLPVLGADTAVEIDGDILGKPRDRADALAMLARLAHRTHRVYTAVALREAQGCHVRTQRSEVTFRALTAAEGAAYWATGEPTDKAGAYAIQGFAACFVSDLRGSFSSVMGLPLFETAQLLDAVGVPRWRP